MASGKLRMAAWAAAFWAAVLLAFWLGGRMNRPGSESTDPSAGRRADEALPASTGAGAGPPTAADPAVRRPDPSRSDGAGAAGSAPNRAVASAGSKPEPAAEDMGARDMAPGAIVELNYEFKSEESRRQYESDQRARWEARKAEELVRVTEYLTRELKLDSGQSDRLRRLLEDESRRRVEVVTDLTEGRIDQTDFRRRVDAIRDTARRELETIFTPEQLAHYKTLTPRKQVLLDATIQGH